MYVSLHQMKTRNKTMKKLLLMSLIIMAPFFIIGCYEESKTVNNYEQVDNNDAAEDGNGFRVVQDSIMFGKLTKTIDGLNRFECSQSFGKSDDVDINSFGAYLLINGDIADSGTPRTDSYGGVDGIKFFFILSDEQLNHRVACASEYYSDGEHLRIKSRDYDFSTKEATPSTDTVVEDTTTADDADNADNNTTTDNNETS